MKAKSSPGILSFLTGCILFSISPIANATTFYAKTSGSWNTAANWSTSACGGSAAGTYPGQSGSTDDVVICSGKLMTGNVGVTVNSITMQGSSNQALYINSGITINTTSLTFDDVDLSTTWESTITGGSTTAILNVTGNFVVNSNCTRGTFGQMTLNITGTSTLDGGLNFSSNQGTKTFTGTVTINSPNGVWLDSGGCPYSFGGGLINNNTFTTNSSGYTFTGSGNIGGTSTVTFVYGFIVNGTYTNTGTITTTKNNVADLTGTGTLTMGANSTLNLGRHSNGISNLDASTNTPNTVNYTFSGYGGNVKATTYYNLNFTGNGASMFLTGNTTVSNSLGISTGAGLNSGAFTHTFNGTTTIDGTGYLSTSSTSGVFNFANVTMNGGTLNPGGSQTGTYNFSGTFTISAGYTGIIGSGVMTFNGPININGTLNGTGAFGTGVKTFVGLVTIGSAGTWFYNGYVGAGYLVFQGGITCNNSFQTTAATFNTYNQTLSGTGTITFSGDVVTVTGITVTNNASVVFPILYGASNLLVGTGSWVQGTTGTLNMAGNITITTFNATATGNTVIITSNGTNYLDIRNGVSSTYYNLTLTGNSTQATAFTASTTITNNLVISGGALVHLDSRYGGAAYTHTVGGTLTISGGSTMKWLGNADTDISTANLTLDGGNISHPSTHTGASLTVSNAVLVNASTTNTIDRTPFTFSGTSTVNGTITISNSGGTPINSTNTFVGLFTVSTTGAVTITQYIGTAASPSSGVIVLNGGISVLGSGTFSGTRLYFNNISPQTITGPSTATITLSENVFVNGVTVTNNHDNFIMTKTGAGALQGTGTWVQGTGTLHYWGSTISVSNFSASTTGNTVDYAGTGTQTILNPNSGTTSTYYNLSATNTNTKTLGYNATVNGAVLISGSAVLSVGSYLVSVRGNWTCNSSAATPFLNSGSPQRVTFDGGGSAQYIGGTYSTTFAHLKIDNSSLVYLSQNQIVSADLNVNSGTFDLQDKTCNHTGGAALLITGSGGTIKCGGTSGGYAGTSSNYPDNFSTHNHSGIVEFYGSASQTIPALSSSNAYSSLVISNTNSSGAILIGNTDITNNLTVSANSTLDLSTYTANRTSSGAGTLSVASSGIIICKNNSGGMGTTNYPSNYYTNNHSGTVIFDYAGDITVPSTITYYNLILKNTGTKTLGANLTLNGYLLINDGTTTLNSNGYNISLKGNWTDNGTFTSSTGTVTFNGNANQTLGGTSSTIFNNLTINQGTTGYKVNITQSTVTVNSTLSLQQNNINVQAGSLLLLVSGASVTPDGGSSTSYVEGKMRKNDITSSFIFPVGTSNNWARIKVSGLTSSDDFSAEYTRGLHSDYLDVASGLDHVSQVEYWDLTRENGTSSAYVTIYTEHAGFGSGGINNCGDLVVAHYNSVSTQWEEVGGTIISGSCPDPLNGPVTIETGTAMSSFSPFSFGSRTPNNPLPVGLISVSADYSNGKSIINWITAIEINNDYFTIERSFDGIDFTPVGTLKGAGNSSSLLNYQYMDDLNQIPNLPDQVYYRLKQTDFDGKSVYSEIVFVNTNSSSALIAYPNPAKNGENILISATDFAGAEILVTLMDIFGNKIFSQTFSGTMNNFNYLINSSENHLSPGVYFITLGTEQKSLNRKLIVE